MGRAERKKKVSCTHPPFDLTRKGSLLKFDRKLQSRPARLPSAHRRIFFALIVYIQGLSFFILFFNGFGTYQLHETDQAPLPLCNHMHHDHTTHVPGSNRNTTTHVVCRILEIGFFEVKRARSELIALSI